ncbi:YCII-related protein [Desulfovibrio sp. X2]|uniref:YciI family protein n=1 Tax=Desulfovibrio sp. X2 TaxID=941449 RepID=UPI000358E4E7|nr:YciI family protein [Desulfovibrio sp. X2]EPR37262.1 YCII-related protein [Desulfovibrio sp. X2]
MFIVSLHYTVAIEEIDKHLPAHAVFLKENFANGNFLLSGRKVPRTGGVILATMDDEEALWAVLHKDPFMVHGVAEYALTRFTPSLGRPEAAPFLEVRP